MEKRTIARLTAIFLVLAVIFAGTTVYFIRRGNRMERKELTQHQMHLSHLLHSLDQMETALAKVQYLPEGALRQMLAADLWKESEVASASLSALPVSEERPEQLERYLSQVGDYAYYLLKADAYGKSRDEEWSALAGLHQQAEAMLRAAAALKEQIDTGGASFRQVGWIQKEPSGFQSAVTDTNKELPAYASLIYDGPYSDHISRRTPRALSGKPLLSLEEARQKAAKLFSIPAQQLTEAYTSDGQIPCYGFRSGTRSIAVSKQGGMVLSMTDSRQIKTAMLTGEQAVKKGLAFLKSCGLANMTPSYFTVYEAIATVNFAANEHQTIAYPDLIKVGIALDDGSVVRLDASVYAMNHHDRQNHAPKLSAEHSRALVPPVLTILQEHLAIIPTDGQNEVFCREYVCETGDKTHALLYLNADTGEAEDFLLLIESENGTLTR